MCELVIDDLGVALQRSSLQDNAVSFAGKQLKVISIEDASEIVAEMEQRPNLTALELEGNTIGVDGAKAIAQSLKSKLKFKYAYWRDMLTGRTKEETPKILHSLTTALITSQCHLHTLDLSDNAFGPLGPQGIENFLRSPGAFSLQILKMNNGGIGIHGAKVLGKALNDCYDLSVKAGTPLKLRVFVAGRNRLENPGCTAIASAIQRIGTLEEIQIPQNGIYHQGISALMKACKNNPHMKILNTQDNTFSGKGAKSLADALPKMKQLEVLKIDDCLCRSDGSICIATAISKYTPNLHSLWLSGNEISSSAMLTVFEELKDHPKLQNIYLQANCFGAKFDEVKMAAQNLKIKCVDVGEESDDGGTAEEEEEESEGVCSGEGYESDSEPAYMEPSPVKVNGHVFDVDIFLSKPSEEGLMRLLAEGGANALLRRFQEELDDAEVISRVIIQLSSLITCESYEQVHAPIYRIADDFLRSSLHHINQSNFSNTFSARMGLIKCEGGKLSRPRNEYGAYKLLQHITSQQYMAKNTADILNFLMKKNEM